MEFVKHLPETALALVRHYGRKLWVRVAAMGLFAFVALGLSQLIEPLVPDDMATALPGSAADRLLNLIANAMLAVTTFSLTVMVSVYQSSSTQWTPRVHQLIMQDAVTQNTLAAFIGAYVYALVAIVLREIGIYVDDRALVLFWLTVLVLAFVVWSLIRWTLHLQTLGSLIDTTRQVEHITRAQFEERLDTPCLGATPWTGEVPQDAWPVPSGDSGYLQYLYAEALQQAACEHDVTLYLPCGIGSFVFVNEPMVWVAGDANERDALVEEIKRLAVIGDVRTYDQDPRFGLLVMSEIGSKALSPGVNDPGTAIDVLNRSARILSLYKDETASDGAPQHDRLHVRPLHPHDMIIDAFAGIARDGAGEVEVQQRLQRVMAGLMQHPDEGLSEAAAALGAEFLERAREAITWAPDRDRLVAKAAERVRG
ncbi:DUF2254 domain-containing protein [Tateyamaria omphalii]|uniref:DUF2254 domain-containing protein n=1 Tax=Tateyamaria omphalii TaxID=299262 RepID=A0A1P8MT60_9RHOB|nr:DUF2254 domain-containing protein [Tateyamaria omphalii]APX11287.1 hypothetical protein BWR18_06040 [Tateyamaria omphalii]